MPNAPFICTKICFSVTLNLTNFIVLQFIFSSNIMLTYVCMLTYVSNKFMLEVMSKYLVLSFHRDAEMMREKQKKKDEAKIAQKEKK